MVYIYIYIHIYIYHPSVSYPYIYPVGIYVYIYSIYIYINIHSIPFPGRRKLPRSFSISDRKFSPYTKVIKACSFTVSINCRLCVAWSFRAPHHRGDGIIDECRIAMCARASLREKIESNYIYIYIFKRLKKRRWNEWEIFFDFFLFFSLCVVFFLLFFFFLFFSFFFFSLWFSEFSEQRETLSRKKLNFSRSQASIHIHISIHTNKRRNPQNRRRSTMNFN